MGSVSFGEDEKREAEVELDADTAESAAEVDKVGSVFEAEIGTSGSSRGVVVEDFKIGAGEFSPSGLLGFVEAALFFNS